MKILVIDDDVSIGAAIHGMLSSEFCDIVRVESGRRGIHELAQSFFDLALIDIFMPVMDGIECIRRCRQVAPTVPLIAMSGFRFRHSWGTAPNYLEIACKLGATRHLRKPFQPQDLAAAILGCLAQAGRGAEAPGSSIPNSAYAR
jgi:CheY-like chemotaxis protein